MITRNQQGNGRYMRSMHSGDLPAVLAIERGCYPQPWSSARFAGELANSCAHIFCCIDDDRIVGYLCIWHVAGEVEIHNVATSVECRRCGVAAFMLQYLQLYLDRHAVNDVFLEVRRGNHSAIRLYEQFNFKRLSCRRGYYADGEDAILMCWRRDDS